AHAKVLIHARQEERAGAGPALRGQAVGDLHLMPLGTQPHIQLVRCDPVLIDRLALRNLALELPLTSAEAQHVEMVSVTLDGMVTREDRDPLRLPIGSWQVHGVAAPAVAGPALVSEALHPVSRPDRRLPPK